VNASNHVLNRKHQVSQLGLHLRKEEAYLACTLAVDALLPSSLLAFMLT
jgi:hypothetical protein